MPYKLFPQDVNVDDDGIFIPAREWSAAELAEHLLSMDAERVNRLVVFQPADSSWTSNPDVEGRTLAAYGWLRQHLALPARPAQTE